MVSSIDVAKLSGVSQATVSRVMNTPDKVSAKTREKVLKAMEELNYRPNLIARSLITNRTKTIALISGKLQNAFFAETTDAISKLANEKGYRIMVFFDDGENTKEILNAVLGTKVDGVLMSSIKLDEPLLQDIKVSKLPYVFFNRRPRKGGNYVVTDNRLSGELITNHLIALNHQKIAFISGETNISTFLERMEGFKSVMEQKGLETKSSIVFTNASAEEVERETLKLILTTEEDRPTAIIYATDAMALVGMNVILSNGLTIPGDISVAGIDNNSISSHHAIQLTSVGNKSKEEMGVIAVESLINMINENNWSNRKVLLEPELIVRRTTKLND